jgi:nucleoid DNA-binding protein
MAKQDVIKAVQEKMGGTVSQEAIGKVLDATFEVIKDLGKDASCRIKDFGTFKVKERAARTGKPIKGGAPIVIPARLAMTFKMAPAFKTSLNPAPVATPAVAPKAEAKKAEKPAKAEKAEKPAKAEKAEKPAKKK